MQPLTIWNTPTALTEKPSGLPSPQVSSEWSEGKDSLQGSFLPFTQWGMNTHTHRCTHMHRHTAVHRTKAFLHAFSIALHTCQNRVQISWKSLISTGLTVHQLFMSRLKLKRQWWLDKAEPVYYCCSAQRSLASHIVRRVTHWVCIFQLQWYDLYLKNTNSW